MSSLKEIIPPLISWFEENKRPLPWREDRSPYHVWISEIMLQQTRIEAVLGYYDRFISALPDEKALSAVSDDALLKLWEGLGYYSRAKNLKKAAVTIMTEYNGRFPSSYEEIRKLSGIGDYTAGAIASICFREKIPAVDGNVLRVIARVTKNFDNVLLSQTKKSVFSALYKVMPDEPGMFNEALMELGETVCLPNGTPLCERCPIRAFCMAYREGMTDQLPVRIKSVQRRREEKTVLLIRSRQGRIAICKRPDKGLLSMMYQLPDISGFLSEEEISARLREWGTKPMWIRFLKETRHVFTHIDWYMKGFEVMAGEESGPFLWVEGEELRSTYPLPTAYQKFL